MTPAEIETFYHDWDFWARKDQRLPPGEWATWLILAGRGWGKTRTSCETLRVWKNQGIGRMAMIGQEPGAVRDVLIYGESGILATSPSWDMPKFESTKLRIIWNNGATCNIYSGADPEKLRGPQHEKILADELFAWDYPEETWDMAQMGLRLGRMPQAVISTTPKPMPLIKKIMNDPATLVTRGSTFDNKHNLPDQFFKNVISKYEGTRLGRQELYGDVLLDNPDSLWDNAMLDDHRVKEAPQLVRIVVAIDPATTDNKNSDEAGIIVVGKDKNGQAYVLEDASLKASPDVWARRAVRAYKTWLADRIIAETNQGGDMVKLTLQTVDKNIPYKGVHATKGKYTRAEPVAALYEQGKVHHVGCFQKLEEELTSWTPGTKSPNRLDALVWALTELMLGTSSYTGVINLASSLGMAKSSRWRR